MRSKNELEANGHVRRKQPTGWFAAGGQFGRAMKLVSDAAFKLLVFICLKADRASGRYRGRKDELALEVGMVRAQLDGCLAELEAKRICWATAHEEDGASDCTVHIAGDFWPYTGRSRGAAPAPASDYVARVRRLFVKLGCTCGRFSSHDARLARDWQQRRVPLVTVGSPAT